MKSAVDKVAKDFGLVELCKCKLKAKKWDTSTSVKFVTDEADKVMALKDATMTTWVEMSCDKHEDMKTKELEDKLEEAKDHMKVVLDSFTALTKNVLNEFRS